MLGSMFMITNTVAHPLDVWQRLTGKFKDVCRSPNKNKEKLRELVPRESTSQGQKPLSHDDEDEEDLMQSQDPVIGTDGC